VTDHSHDGTDEGFHEIQLSGKQLVFLFMATTVVSVVIFLCGVLVGRGVKGDTLNAAEPPPTAPTATAGTTSTPEPPPTTIDAPAATSELTYAKRLDGAKPVREELKEAKPAVTPAPKAVVEPPPPTPAPEPKPATPASTPAAMPQGSKSGAFAVQVVALSDRGAANAVVQRLSAKGYQAFVVVPAPTAVQHFKVQVGRFADRSEAEQIRQRLKKEEQFEPIIVR
jgi:DedD protein